MPKLPSVQSLGESPVPNPQRGVYGYRAGIAEEAELRVAEDMVQGGEKLMRWGDNMQDRVDRLEYSRAKAAFLRSKVEADNSFEQDPDYTTYGKRYTERMASARDNALKMVTNGRVRETLMGEMAIEYERGVAGIREKAWGKEKDANRAFLSRDIEESTKSALQADRPTASAILDTLSAQINASRDRGYITAQEAEKMRQEAAAGYAIQRVSLMPHDKQLAALKAGMSQAQEGELPIFSKTGTEVDFIPPAKRMEMIRGAEEKTRQSRAITAADQITGPLSSGNMDLNGWLKKAQEIKDPVEREAVESRLVTEYNRRNAIKTEGERKTREAAWDIVQKTKSMDGLDGPMLAALSASDKIQMENYVKRAGEIEPNTQLYIELNLMSVQDRDKFKSLDLNQYRGQTSDQMIRHFSDLQRNIIQHEASAAGRAEVANAKELEKARAASENLEVAGRAIKQAAGILQSAGIDTSPKNGSDGEKKLKEFQSELVNRISDFQKEKQRKATDTEAKSIIDGLLLEGRVRGGGFFGSEIGNTTRLYQVKPEDLDKFYVPIERIPAKDKTQILEALKSKGIESTNENVEKFYAYNKMRAAAVNVSGVKLPEPPAKPKPNPQPAQPKPKAPPAETFQTRSDDGP